MESLIGETIDNYNILSIIGRGGMGVVFKARDISLDKIVALKMIDPILARDTVFMSRFQTEARALAKLENPYIVNVYALRETDKGTFIVMEYVNPKNLTDWIKERGAFSWQDVLKISIQLVTAIGYAHKVGVLHRDIKPSNILLTDDLKIKVTDFGLAKDTQAQDSGATVAQMRAGTLNYMSPEQVKGLKNVDKRSDIYSLGMTIFEMLTGRVPFEKSDSEFTIQKKIVDGKIPSPIKFNTQIPKQLVKIIVKATEADPLKRYQEAGDMLLDLKEFQKKAAAQNGDSSTEDTGAGIPTPAKQFNKKIIYISAGIVAACVILFFVVRALLVQPEMLTGEVQDDTGVKDTIQIIDERPADFGKIEIVSNPVGAELLINNKFAGITPLTLDSLMVGKYQLKLSKNGYKNWQNSSYIVKAGETMSLNVIMQPMELARANLTLKAVPSGTVTIDNELIGEAASALSKSLEPGKYKIKFTHPNFGEKTATVLLKEGENKKLTCYFQKFVNIQSLNEAGEAVWASIFLNDEATDYYTPKVLPLSPGKYKIYVRKAGFETIEEGKLITVKPSFSEEHLPIVFHIKKL